MEKPKPSKAMAGLPGFFAKLESKPNSIDQSIGLALAPFSAVAPESAGNLSKKDAEFAKQLSMCGKCIGVHLADWAKDLPVMTSVTEDLRVSVDGDYRSFREALYKFNVVNDRRWPTRDYEQGVRALYRRLMRLPRESHFKRWWRRNADGFSISRMQQYLHEFCDAPRQCFGTSMWPWPKKASRVFKNLLRLNYAV